MLSCSKVSAGGCGEIILENDMCVNALREGVEIYNDKINRNYDKYILFFDGAAFCAERLKKDDEIS